TCRPAATVRASSDCAGDSDSTDRSHIVTGVVAASATTAPAATHRPRPRTTVATDAAKAVQQATARAACSATYRDRSLPARRSSTGTPGGRLPAHSARLAQGASAVAAKSPVSCQESGARPWSCHHRSSASSGAATRATTSPGARRGATGVAVVGAPAGASTVRLTAAPWSRRRPYPAPAAAHAGPAAGGSGQHDEVVAVHHLVGHALRQLGRAQPGHLAQAGGV